MTSNERVSDKRLTELVSHYENVDKQHNGWWVAVYWCLRELQERRSADETTGCQHCETLKARVKLLEGETSRMFGELFQIAAERRNSSPEEPSCTCGYPKLPRGTAHRRDCALYDGSSLEPPEQLYRLRPLCICDNALTSQNPACPIHGSSENGEASQA